MYCPKVEHLQRTVLKVCHTQNIVKLTVNIVGNFHYTLYSIQCIQCIQCIECIHCIHCIHCMQCIQCIQCWPVQMSLHGHKLPVPRRSLTGRRPLLYWTVLYCIVLYCIVLYFIVLYCIVLYCIVLYCILLTDPV